MAISTPLLVGLAFTTGCETSTGTFALSQMYSANAAIAKNPNQARAWQMLGNVAAFHAQQQAAQELQSTPQHIVIHKEQAVPQIIIVRD